MPRLPARFAAVILCFAPLFWQRSWRHAEVLLVGAILAPGPAYGEQHSADQRALPGTTVRELSPRAEPRRLERTSGS